MKLLKQSVVSVEAAHQKQIQIDEGIKIARKVDSLRETLANLETQFQTTVERHKIELKQQLQELLTAKKYLESELSELKETRKKLSEPLDAQWEVVNNRLNEVNLIKEESLQKLGTIELKEINIIEKEKDIKDRLTQIKIREKELTKALNKAIEDSEKKDKLLKDADERVKITNEYLESKVEELKSREIDIASKERDLENTRRNLEIDREEITKQKAQLDDRQKTLERAIKRTKKK